MIFHSYVSLPEGIPLKSHETTIFLWFSYGFPNRCQPALYLWVHAPRHLVTVATDPRFEGSTYPYHPVNVYIDVGKKHMEIDRLYAIDISVVDIDMNRGIDTVYTYVYTLYTYIYIYMI